MSRGFHSRDLQSPSRDVFEAMANSYGVSIVATFDLVDIEVLRHFSNRRTAKGTFHGTNARAIEKANYASVTVILLRAKLVEPLVNHGRDAPLLRSDFGVNCFHRATHFGCRRRRSSAKHQSVSFPGRFIRRSRHAFRLVPAAMARANSEGE